MPTIHIENIRALIELQDKDTVILQLSREAEVHLPAAAEAVKKDFEEKKKAMDTAKAALLKLQSEKKSAELSVAEKDAEIAKHQKELNAIKDNAAFKAMMTQIDNCKADKDAAETKVLELMDAIDKAQAEDKRIQSEMKNVDAERDSKLRDISAKLEAANARLGSLKAERDGLAAKVEPAILEKYDFIRGRKHGLALAAVKTDPANGKFSCGGCNMALTPQLSVDVKKKETLVFCENCQRMIYLPATAGL